MPNLFETPINATVEDHFRDGVSAVEALTIKALFRRQSLVFM